VSVTARWLFAWHTGLCGPRFRGRCAGLLKCCAVEGLGECVSEENEKPRSRLSKRRRANAPAGTKKRRGVWVTAEEEAALVAKAARQKVTVPNLLLTAALSESAETPTERRAAMAELMAIHTLLARVSNNVNQIARHANAGDEFPQDAKAALAYVREVAMRIDRTIEGLM
jgi:Bacterial mobilisation protein (MobC)